MRVEPGDLCFTSLFCFRPHDCVLILARHRRSTGYLYSCLMSSGEVKSLWESTIHSVISVRSV